MKLPYQVKKYDNGWLVKNIHTDKVIGWFDEAEDRPLRQAELLRNRLNTKHGLYEWGL